MNLFYIDRRSDTPLHIQVYNELRTAILNGRILPRNKLPSTRALASELKVARLVILEAYDRLLAEGYIETRIGSGTYVASNLEIRTPQPKLRMAAAPSYTPLKDESFDINYPDLFETKSPRLFVDFRPGQPALEAFPRRKWAKTLTNAILQAHAVVLDYGPVAGLPRLRAALAMYLSQARGLSIAKERVIVTTGTTQAIDLITRACVDAGATVAVEDPCSAVVQHTFKQAGARLLPIPVDQNGLCVDVLFNMHGTFAPRVVYITPSHQYPTGSVLSLERRLRLLAWAEDNQALIIEDDYDSEFRYDLSPIPAIAGLDQLGHVAYLGTFSKTFFPALRVGYAVLPQWLLKPFLVKKWQADRQTAVLEQISLAEWLETGQFARHIQRMRRLYAERRSALVSALQQFFGDCVSIQGTAAGLHLYTEFRLGLSEQSLIDLAAAAAVKVYPASPTYLEYRSTAPALLFGYGGVESAKVLEGVTRLAAAWCHATQEVGV